jgi:hypothetical protein
MPPRRADAPRCEHYESLLAEELRDGLVQGVTEQQVPWLSPTFLHPKPDGRYRKFLNCAALNEEMLAPHFKMETAEDVLRLARPGDWGTSLDFSSAVNHIAVSSQLKPYLCFLHRGRYFQYQAMPFGLTQASFTFTRLMKRAVTAVRARWKVRMVFYMDDSLLLFEQEE